MPKIADIIAPEIDEDIRIPGVDPEGVKNDSWDPNIENSGFSFDLSILKTPTGDGSIDSYLDHPLNPNGSRGIAQMLRGATGFVGELKFALVDIILGYFNFTREKVSNYADTIRQ
jgi:hypothetical protein